MARDKFSDLLRAVGSTSAALANKSACRLVAATSSESVIETFLILTSELCFERLTPEIIQEIKESLIVLSPVEASFRVYAQVIFQPGRKGHGARIILHSS
jgi:hypothetical protein